MQRSTKVQLLGFAGFFIAMYALSVEMHMNDPSYEALCDLSATFSCTAVFSSEYAHLCQSAKCLGTSTNASISPAISVAADVVEAAQRTALHARLEACAQGAGDLIQV